MIVEISGDEYTRLHISPLHSDLLSAYLGPTLASEARNISYHSIQTLPERSFGYVDLPTMEATKLKRKLNGSIFKGSKVSVDVARAEKRRRSSEAKAGDEEEGKTKKKTRRGKRACAKDRNGAIEGYKLEEGRRVKRGWTETPAEKRGEKETDKSCMSEKWDKKEKKSRREASKYTSEPECLFRTKTSFNMDPNADALAKKKQAKPGVTVLHEFRNTKKHSSFLKSGGVLLGVKATQEYVDGRGWVDAEGNVLEEETEKRREKRERRQKRAIDKASKSAREQDPTNPYELTPPIGDRIGKGLHGDQGLGLSTNEEARTPHNSSEEPTSAIHPLEALYKRPKLANIDTTTTTRYSNFNFFDGNTDDSDIERNDEASDEAANSLPPLTPHTTGYADWREIRSAAPTPDTAAIGKKFFFPGNDEDSESEDADAEPHGEARFSPSVGQLPADGDDHKSEDGEEKSEGQPDAEKPREESDFAKWFYEHRSDNNKLWRAHRREALKLSRKRENRRLTRRLL